MNETIKKLRRMLQVGKRLESDDLVWVTFEAVPELLTYIEELEKKAEAGGMLADYLRNGLLPEDDQMALAAYDNATKDA